MSKIKTVGVVGAGLIGAGWAARFLSWGLNVVAWDPDPNAKTSMLASIENAWPSCIKLGVSEGASVDNLIWVSSLEELCKKSDFIQESAPDRIEIKQQLHADMSAMTDSKIIIASSSSGLLPTDIQQGCRYSERIIIGHPFNPVYLLPLCEVVGGEKTSQSNINKAIDFYTSIGMECLHVRKEIDGYLADRLQEALWREILHLVNDDVATTDELDKAVNYGFGLRLAVMGVNQIFYLAGGNTGMRHMLEQFGPALKLPWSYMEAPELSDSLINKMVEGTSKLAAGKTVKEMEVLRDNCLIAIMRALREFEQGAGTIIAGDEARRLKAIKRCASWLPSDQIDAPLQLYRCLVKPEWVDYNGHMSEAEYLTAFGWASDALFRYIGDDEDYRASGLSFYTVETHINYYQECGTGDPLRFETIMLGSDIKRMHLFHKMFHEITGDLLATTEQMLLHVDTKASCAAPIRDDVFAAVQAITKAHEHIEVPAEVGHQMKIKKKP